jgi:Ca2+-transporting ATPase
MGQEGLRVLGVAEARWRGEEFPESQSHFDFAFRGLVGLSDPIREIGARPWRVRSAGVRVVMITGDYPATARAIAAQAGIEPTGEVMTGSELDALDDAALARRIRAVSVFARVMPEQKLRIVEALKAAGEIVAMTGDGVNDAPSLKAAHIGVAMGKRGTEVAREASAIVLLDDDFSAIPQGHAAGAQDL